MGKSCQSDISNQDNNESVGSSQESEEVSLLRSEVAQLRSIVDKIHGKEGDKYVDISGQKAYLAAAGESLDKLLLKDPTQPVDKPTFSTSQFGSYDPRHMLTIKARERPLHVTDFLTETTKQRIRGKRQNLVVQNLQDGTMQVKPDESHPYSGINLGEWGAANTRLLGKLLSSGRLQHSEVEYYLAYTAMVFDFHSRYQWASVLNFDYYYREHQAEHGFMWGFVNPSLEMSWLRPLDTTPMRYSNPMDLARPKGESQNCHQWLAYGRCRFGDHCKFLHPSGSATTHNYINRPEYPFRGPTPNHAPPDQRQPHA